MAAGGEKEKKSKKREKKEKKVLVPAAEDPKEKGMLTRHSPAARSGDAIRVSAKDGKSYAEILKAKFNAQNLGAEALYPENQQGGDPPGPQKMG